MPQITNVRVMRFRKVQPEQYGGAGAEVELHATVLEGEDYRDITRGLLFDARAMVYENLGMMNALKAAEKSADKADPEVTELAKEDDLSQAETPAEEVDKEPDTEKAPKKRGRPKGSKNTRPKKGSKAAEEAATEPATVAADEIPGGDNSDEKSMPQVSTNPEDRVDPDAIPGEEPATEPEPEAEETAEPEMDAPGLKDYITNKIRANEITGMQAQQMMKQMKIARISELDTPEKIAQGKMMIDAFVSGNKKG